MPEPAEVGIDDRRHTVGFYGEPLDFAASIGAYAAVGLRRGETVLALVTADHATALDDRLTAAGFDVAELRATGRYVTVDAHQVLDGLLVDGAVDRACFAAEVAVVVTELATGPAPLRVFVELVGVLWTDGHAAATFEVERLWNELQAAVPFALHCGYQVDGTGPERDLGLLGRVCGLHTAFTTASWPLGDATSGAVPTIDDSCVRVFLPTLTAPRAVRRFVRHALRCWDLGAVADEVQLVASELATNAVVHAGSPFELALVRDQGLLTLRVRDASPAPPTRRHPDLRTPSGRGLGIVAELASAWGVDPRDDGKVVWVELDAAGVAT